jgi:hypothetical protein
MAGAGKTAVAVAAAHRARPRFPDGQLYADMHGFSRAAAVSPFDALGRLLTGSGMPADRLPSDVDSRAALFRSVLADRRVLVVLDNVSRAEDVLPLLPGTPGNAVLITSRDELRTLETTTPVQRLHLDVLEPSAAEELLTTALAAAPADPCDVAALAAACGHHPLALHIAATAITTTPGESVPGFTARLTPGNRLPSLRLDDHPVLETAFTQSYTRLSPEDRTILHRLAAASASFTTADTRLPQPGATRFLARMTAANLLTAAGTGRHAFHPMLQEYLATRTVPHPWSVMAV